MARINNQIQPSWDGIGKGKKNGLIKRWRVISAKICNRIVNTDKIPTKMVKERNFKVHPPDDGRIKHKEAIGIISYTDGSVLEKKTGLWCSHSPRKEGHLQWLFLPRKSTYSISGRSDCH